MKSGVKICDLHGMGFLSRHAAMLCVLPFLYTICIWNLEAKNYCSSYSTFTANNTHFISTLFKRGAVISLAQKGVKFFEYLQCNFLKLKTIYLSKKTRTAFVF